jgi:uncharacterized phage-like protein YoqJ
MVISFCGHSTFIKTPEIEEQLLSILESQVGDEPADFYLGGYGSFDSFARECCQNYQSEHPHAKLVLITPYMTIEHQKNHLAYQKDYYDAIVYPEIEDKPLKFAISYRNKWMAEQADLVIAYVNHNSGGAWQTYQHAKRKKKTIINLGKLD